MNWNDVFEYRDGNLYWRSSPQPKVCAGDLAGTIVDGYVKVMVDKKSYSAHRVIWEMMNGLIPDGMQIDHINHIRNDNRIENLRIVSKQLNMENKSKYKNNKSGITGVNFNIKKGRFISQIQIKGRKKMLYEGLDLFEAVCKRKSAEICLNFHENHGV